MKTGTRYVHTPTRATCWVFWKGLVYAEPACKLNYYSTRLGVWRTFKIVQVRVRQHRRVVVMGSFHRCHIAGVNGLSAHFTAPTESPDLVFGFAAGYLFNCVECGALDFECLARTFVG